MRRWVHGAAPWVLVVPGAMWVVVRLGGWDHWHPAAQLIAFTPYVAAASLAPLAIVALMRRWAATAVAGLTALALATCVLPRGFADSDALAGATGPELRVMTANVRAGQASARTLVELVREHNVDVLAVQELTPRFLTALERAGLPALLGHRVAYPGSSVDGSGLFARLPLRDDGLRLHSLGLGQAAATLTELGIAIESVHPLAPSESRRLPVWRRSLQAQSRATMDGPIRILAGDFNATLDHSLLRAIISDGYRDAAAAVGKGFTGTWGPYDGDRIPPVTLDRVLADRRIGVRQVEIFDLPGSDHRPVLAVLVLPTASAKAG